MGRKKKSKTDEEVLFSEEKVGKYTIKPWSFGILFEISEMLDGIFEKIEAKGINLEFKAEFIPYSTIVRIFAVSAPEIKKIIATTLGLEESEVERMSMEDGVRSAFVIFKQNWGVVKNVLSLSLPEIAMEIMEEETGEEKEEEKKE